MRSQDNYPPSLRPRAAVNPLATTRAVVTVTFLRQDRAPPAAAPLRGLVRLKQPTVSIYRYLYDNVGAAHLWWLRRTVPDGQLAALLADPAVSLHVLYRDGEPAGFFELDGRAPALVNLSYFGLLPHAIGHGYGTPLLQAAMEAAWSRNPVALTVNTCTADHPRALPTYLRAGFYKVRSSREVWDVPDRLGLVIPDHVRG